MEKRAQDENGNSCSQNPRCVNLDWLEVYCLEPVREPHTPDYYRQRGYHVQEREYGTRVYKQMFTLFGSDEWPLLEIRRDPASSDQQFGILPFNACHVRLCNRTCYYDDAAQQLSAFLSLHGLVFQRISRVDVCLDFERFDSGDWPAKFLRRYLQERFAKINQARINNHGEDAWTTRRWDSISWGRLKSDVSTKLYNKTKQLAEVKDKPYIKQAWFLCGLVDDPVACTKKTAGGAVYSPEIWRVEFSVRSSVKNWFTIEEDGNTRRKRSLRNTLDMWTGRDMLLTMFSSLAQHYFHFKIVEKGKRKDLCKDKVLFRWRANETFYKVERLASPLPQRPAAERLLARLNEFAMSHPGKEVSQAVKVIADVIDNENKSRYLQDPFSRRELLLLREAIAWRSMHGELDPSFILDKLKTLMDELPERPF